MIGALAIIMIGPVCLVVVLVALRRNQNKPDRMQLQNSGSVFAPHYANGVGWYLEQGLEKRILRANAAEFLTEHLSEVRQVSSRSQEEAMFAQAGKIGLSSTLLREVGHELDLYGLGIWRFPAGHPALQNIVAD